MKTYKVEIPEDRIDFMLSLFQNFKFISYKESTDEPPTYIAKGYMQNKGLLPKETKPSVEEQLKNKIKGLSGLRDTINRIQESRTLSESTNEITFRLPGSKNDGKLLKFTSLNDLKLYLENYLRIHVEKIEFTPNKASKQNPNDSYMIKALVKDANSKLTVIPAGFSNQILKG